MYSNFFQAHQIIIRRNVTLLWVFVVLIQPIISSVTGKSEEILYASNLHQELCEPLNDSVLSANKCCGFCNTDIDCAIYGTCCLRAFESFDIGKLSLQAARSVSMTSDKVSPFEAWNIQKKTNIEGYVSIFFFFWGGGGGGGRIN